jgi:hypothetical protein
MLMAACTSGGSPPEGAPFWPGIAETKVEVMREDFRVPGFILGIFIDVSPTLTGPLPPTLYSGILIKQAALLGLRKKSKKRKKDQSSPHFDT